MQTNANRQYCGERRAQSANDDSSVHLSSPNDFVETIRKTTEDRKSLGRF